MSRHQIRCKRGRAEGALYVDKVIWLRLMRFGFRRVQRRMRSAWLSLQNSVSWRCFLALARLALPRLM